MSRYVKVEDIMWYINTDNRGSCDYFIVDEIEELCNSNKVVDLADHDKRIRNEVIDEFVDALTCQACFTNMQKDAIRIYAEQMKGEQNGCI